MKNGTFYVIQSNDGWQVVEKQGDTLISHFFTQPSAWIADELVRRFNIVKDVIAYARHHADDEFYNSIFHDVAQMRDFSPWETR